MLGAILLGLVAGYLARALTPGRQVTGCLPTIAVGLVGSLLGYFIFTEALDVGDAEMLDFGGLPGAIIGTILVLVLLGSVADRRERPPARRGRRG